MTPLSKALVILAVVLSGVSLFISGNRTEQVSNIPVKKTERVDTQKIEQTLQQLQAELITLSTRLDALETPLDLEDPKKLADAPGKSKSALATEKAIAARVDEAVEKALDQKGVALVKRAQLQAKRDSNREGFDKFVTSYGDGLPQVYQTIGDKMGLDRNRQQQLEETLEAGWARMDELTGQLLSGDLPPEEERALMGEIKSVGGETIAELGTFLNGGEMLQLGEIMMATEGTERMGYGVAGAGKETLNEEGQQGGSQ